MTPTAWACSGRSARSTSSATPSTRTTWPQPTAASADKTATQAKKGNGSVPRDDRAVDVEVDKGDRDMVLLQAPRDLGRDRGRAVAAADASDGDRDRAGPGATPIAVRHAHERA